MLIGGSLLWSLLSIGQIILPTGIILQKTQLGFIAVGTHNTIYGIPNDPLANRMACNLAVSRYLIFRKLDNQILRIRKFGYGL